MAVLIDSLQRHVVFVWWWQQRQLWRLWSPQCCRSIRPLHPLLQNNCTGYTVSYMIYRRLWCALFCYRYVIILLWTHLTYLPIWLPQCQRSNPGPCITNVIATCRKNFSQWESSFLWKLRYHWLKFLRRVAKTLVIQGPGWINSVTRVVSHV